MSDQDLLRYYKVLKQFLDISDDTTSATRSKSNSSRAQRAREKLLKLSSAQFKELSTDVYDELKRRIDESRTEPDFLLPKLSFHPKRNQARQKLSSLPQSRFKDLVSDISFEIERRNLHVSTHSTSVDSNAPTPTHQQTLSQDHSISEKDHFRGPSSEFGASSHSQYESAGYGQSNAHNQNGQHSTQPSLADNSLLNDLATPKIELTSQQKTIGVQPTTVVPTKANLAWSSDEEEEKEEEEKEVHKKALEISQRPNVDDLRNSHQEEQVIRRISLSNGFAPQFYPVGGETAQKLEKVIEENHPPQTSDLQLQLADLEERNKQLESELSRLQEAHNELLENHSTVTAANKNLESLVSELQQQQSTFVSTETHSNLIEELESLKSANAAIRLENQALKNSQPRTPRSPDGQADSGISREVSRGQVEPATQVHPLDINSHLEKLFSKMDNQPQRAADASAISQLQSEVIKWQKRYEDVQAGRISSAVRSSTNMFKDIKEYLSPSGEVPLETASKFFASIDSFVVSLNSEPLLNDTLFEQMSRIALVANNIASHGQEGVFNEDVHSGFVREAAGHALTATRYFASYRQLLPKVVVERAVAEVAFAVCDFISRFKLIDTNDSELKDTRKNIVLPLRESGESNKNISVRPLKITSKVQSTHSSEPLAASLKEKENPVTQAPVSLVTKSAEPSVPGIHRLEEQNVDRDFDKKVEPLQSQAKKSIFEKLQTPKSAIVREADNTDDPVSLSREVTQLTVKTSTETKSPPETPKKSSILDRVRQFESPQEVKTTSPSTPLRSVNLKFHDDQKVKDQVAEDIPDEDKSPIASSSPKATGEITRGKSIFQSLREKFANDKAVKPEEKSDPQNNSNGNISYGNISNGNNSNGNISIGEHGANIDSSVDSVTDSKVPDVEQSIAKPVLDADINSGKNVIDENVEALNIHTKDTSSKQEGPDNVASQVKAAVVEDIAPLKVNDAAEMPGSFDKGSNDEPARAESSSDRDSIYEEASEEAPSPIVAETVIPEKSTGTKELQEPSRSLSLGFRGIPVKAPSFKVKKVNYAEEQESDSEYDNDNEEDEEDEEEEEARQRQEYRKSMAAATFNFDLFDIDDPDNTLTQVLLYLEHQTVQVITTIQDLLSAIKRPDSTRGELRENSMAISEVIKQMTEATNTSMNQTRNFQLKEHGSWVVKSLEDCNHRMNTLCRSNTDRNDLDFADKNFKQRLAGISFDIAKCTKELVKTVEEASLKEDIAHLDARLNHHDDLT